MFIDGTHYRHPLRTDVEIAPGVVRVVPDVGRPHVAQTRFKTLGVVRRERYRETKLERVS